MIVGNPQPEAAENNLRPRFSAASCITTKFVVCGYGMFTARLALFQRVNGGGPSQIAERAGRVGRWLSKAGSTFDKRGSFRRHR
jgi:hypothetical protein